MFVDKFILITSVLALAIEGKIVMDDINVEANPDYLTISSSLDKSGSEPLVNIEADLKKDILDIKVKASLSAAIAGEFQEIYEAKGFNPCEDGTGDDFVKYALDEIEKFGNLKITCPMKAGHYAVQNFKLDDTDTRAQSFGNGRFRVNVQAYAVNGGEETELMMIKFSFHSE